MVPTVLEPLKFYCIIETDLSKFRFVVLRRNLVPPFQRRRILQISEHKSLTSGPEGTATLCILLFKHPATPRGSKFLSHRKLIIICLIDVPPFYPKISDHIWTNLLPRERSLDRAQRPLESSQNKTLSWPHKRILLQSNIFLQYAQNSF